MKKAKLAIGIMSALLSVGALAACSDVKYDEDGVILTYTGADGKTAKYTADDLLDEESKDNQQVVFDAVYKMIIKNYFTETDPDDSEFGKKQLAGLKTKATTAVESDKDKAEKAAESNGTSYDTEFSSILKEKGCEDEDELFEHYLYQYEEETFNDNFEKISTNMQIMKEGTDSVQDPKGLYTDNKWNGYFEDRVPYHLSHILVKISDSSSTNYYNAKISEDNAHKLHRVVEALRKSTWGSFGQTAKNESDDSAERGDLGVVDMDKTEGYINEFKYAVYAYENLYGKTAEAQASAISIKNGKTGDDKFDIVEDYENVNHLAEDTLSAEGFATIPYGIFEVIENNASRERGYQGQKVNDGNEDFFPRNIYFNHYLNRHSLALITPNKAKAVAAGEFMTDTWDGVYDETLKDGKEGTGFHNFTAEDGVNFTGTYLATSMKLGDKVVYRPILVVRGGSGEGGYQGIHFIVVNRSPFEYVDGESASHIASLGDYYTTYVPKTSNYPQYETTSGSKTDYQTYVNYHKDSKTDAQIQSDYRSRADEVKSTIKGYESEGLKFFMFKKYLKAGKLSFKDAEYAKRLNTWMTDTVQNKVYTSQTEWRNNWVSYIENLKQATDIQSRKTIKTACAISFSAKDHATDPAWRDIGGDCNDGEQH